MVLFGGRPRLRPGDVSRQLETLIMSPVLAMSSTENPTRAPVPGTMLGSMNRNSVDRWPLIAAQRRNQRALRQAAVAIFNRAYCGTNAANREDGLP